MAASYAGRTPRLNIWMIASEASPWAKTGGLGDVLGALPGALAAQGHRVTLVLPRYRGVEPPDEAAREPVRVRMGAAEYDVGLVELVRAPNQRVLFVDYPPFFDRDGLYGVGGRDFSDNAERFGLLSLAALDAAERDPARVDVVHAHDWQAGLAPAFIADAPARWPRLAADAGVVCTIHNLAYQGRFPRDVVPKIGLSWRAFTMDGAEFWNELNCLKAGINFSDWVTTVSPRYAEETQTPEFGAGLEGVLQARRGRYVGILNGIDTAIWNPATDPWLPAHYDAEHLDGKRACKRAVLEDFGLPIGDNALNRPLVGCVSRLVDQKGFDLIAEVGAELLALDLTWVAVGTGDAKYETMWRAWRAAHPSRVGAFIGFDERRAHMTEAGADMFLMPSRFEPCGLNQMYSLRYGTVPIVRAVGGLDDTVRPYTARSQSANGFKFKPATGAALLQTVRQAVRVFGDVAAWRRLMRQGMADDHSWDQASREYVKVYRRARRDALLRGVPGRPILRG